MMESDAPYNEKSYKVTYVATVYGALDIQYRDTHTQDDDLIQYAKEAIENAWGEYLESIDENSLHIEKTKY